MIRLLLAGAALLLAPAAWATPAFGPPDEASAEDDSTPPDLPRGVAALPEETPSDIRTLATSGAGVGDMMQALGLAYWTSPAVLAQRAQLKSDDYRIPEARAAYGVTLDYQLMAGWQRDRNDPTVLQRELGQTTPTTSWGWSNSAMAVLTMPLFSFGRNFAAERTAQATRAYQKQILRQTEQQALFDAINAYAGLIRDRANVAIARDNLAALDRDLNDNKARLAVHEITVTDLSLIEARAEQARAGLYGAEAQAQSSEAAFVQKVGAPAMPALAAPAPIGLPVKTLEEAYAYAEAHSPVILAAHERERVSRAGVAAARADLMPRVDLRAQALYASQSPYNNYARYNEEIASVVVTGPLFESGLRRTRVAEAIAANDSDWRLIDGATRDTRAAIAAAWNDREAQTAAAARYTQAAAAAQKAYDGALIQQREGQITTFDVLQVLLEVLSARSNANQAAANITLDNARIMALIGGLDPALILPDMPRYDDTRHLDAVHHRDDIPLVTPLLRALDGVTTPGNGLRGTRDPAVGVKVPGVKVE